MFKTNKLLFFLLTPFVLIFNPYGFAEETVTITTYYPSPYGIYSALETDKLGVGDNNGDTLFTSADVPSTSGDVWIKGKVGIGTMNPTFGPLQMGSGAYVSAGGVWTNASSRAYKQDIAPLGLDKAIKILTGLQPVTFSYKRAPDEQHVGFIAEDVPELVATKDHTGLSAMDIVAVLTKAVQEQQKEIESLKQEVGRLKRE